MNLTGNKIENIKGLSNFEKLEKLYVEENKISDINELKDVKFKDSLKELKLSKNRKLTNVNILKEVKFENIQRIYLLGLNLEKTKTRDEIQANYPSKNGEIVII